MSNNETLADILAEMRRHIQAVRNYPQDIDITDGDVEDWADRIEAAYARDIGNAAALREALVKTLDAFKSGAIRTEWNDPDSWKHDDELWYLKNDIESALAAPARNCDRFANTAQALGAYPDGPPIGDDWDDADWMIFLDWLFTPAEGGGEALEDEQ